jgi:NADH:ubiquinone oxidoreductase subunit E
MSNATSMDVIRERYRDAGREALIPILQDLQAFEGYLAEPSLHEVSRMLSLPLSKIYGVASFYNQFRFQPIGRYHVLVCRGTACHVKNSVKLLQAVQHHLKIEPGQTTRDGLFTLDVVACIGACGLAPVMCINGEFHAKLTPDGAVRIITELGSAHDHKQQAV